jgi:peptide/nickel transport system permease protein
MAKPMDQPLESPSPTTVTPVVSTAPQRPRFRRLRLLRRSPAAMIGVAIVLFWVFIALFGAYIAPYGINQTEAGAVWNPPSAAHPLGTDGLGRDMFSRLIIGAQTMIILPPLAIGIAVILGTSIGLFTGYRRGWTDEIVMRFMDAMMAFPVVMLYILVIVAVGQSAVTVVLAVAVANTPAISRLVRGLVLDLRNREFVAAARMRGESTRYILFREILPNASGPILVDALVRVGYAAFAIGTLGFLGMGVPPPNPDWGRMVYEAKSAINLTPTAPIFPALAISSLVIACNLIADGLSEAVKKDE